MRRAVQILASLVLALGWWPMTSWGQEPVLDAANAFVTRWQGEAGKNIRVPLYGNYAYRWEKADGTEVKVGEANVARTELLELPVAEAGEYVLKAGPVGVRWIEFGTWNGKWYNGSRGTPGALLRVEKWGRVAWESFAGAFYRCGNMNIAEGAGRPDLSGVQSMHSAFEGCGSFNSPIGDWDVSKVENMGYMFYECSSFNQPLEQWDVSRVTSMLDMFRGCSSFNQPLGDWDVSKVEDMRYMFYNSTSFNQPLGGWTLSALAHDEEGYHELGLMYIGLDVENYSATLAGWAAKRDQQRAGVRVDARGLFFDAAGQAARQQLIYEKGWRFSGDQLAMPVDPLDPANAFITRWQGEAGKPIRVPLYGQYSYEWVRVAGGAVVASGEVRVAEGELLSLPVPEDGEYVLKAGPAGVKRIEFGVWDNTWELYDDYRGTPKALLQVMRWGSVAWESFAGAFVWCANMNIAEGAGKPDLSGVQSMHSAFAGCSSFNSPIGDWDVSQVTSMRSMFNGCSAFNQPLGAWDVSRVTDMVGMFHGCSSFNQPLEDWDVSKVTNMGGMFRECSAFNQPLEKWDVSQVENMRGMFLGCVAFNQPLEKWDVSQVENMRGMFLGCVAFNQPLEKWDVSRVTDMKWMFEECSAFNQPLGGWTLSALKRDEGWDHDLGFQGSGLDAANYSATLVAWAAKRDKLQAGVRVRADGLWHNATGEAARQQLMDDKGWEFIGDDQLAPIAPLDAANAFITRWQGEAGKPIRVPLYGQYSYEWIRVDGGAVVASGEVRVGETRLLELAVPADGEYVLKAGPAGVKRIEFGEWNNERKYYSGYRGTPEALLRVEQWGSVVWESFAGAFYECENMNIAEGAGKPDLSGVASMQSAFWGCKSFNSPIGDWDVSRVTNMRDMFDHCVSFNQPLEKWDVSRVTSMWEMFDGCRAFNQPLGGWTLSALERGGGGDHDLGFQGSGLDAANYTSTLVAWAAKRGQLQGGVRVRAKGLKYDAAGKSARQQLIDDKGWVFAGDGEATVSLTGITVSPTSARLGIGGTQALTVGYAPEDAANKAVTWSSSNESVATVSEEGVVTGKGKGTATITVTSADGGHTATCEVTVTAPVALTGIAVSPTRARIAIGGTQTLTVGYTPADATNKAVTWSSSDEDVATVDVEGLVTGKGKGIAKITATADDGGHTATCAVTVVAPVPLTGIAVSPTRARIAIGGTQALAVRYTPADATNRAVTWCSSDEDVATVDAEGLVTAKGEGIATITATSADGGHTATCAVTVVPPVALTGITVMPTSAQLKVGETQQLALGYTPADATNRRVTWHSSDKGVATVDAQGKVTGVKAGSATITATSADGGHTATCAVTVVGADTPSGVESVALAGVSVSPNPFGDHLTVRGAEGVLRYALVNGSGVVVLEGAHAGGDELRLSTSHLPAGVYWLRLVAVDGERVVQVVRR